VLIPRFIREDLVIKYLAMAELTGKSVRIKFTASFTTACIVLVDVHRDCQVKLTVKCIIIKQQMLHNPTNMSTLVTKTLSKSLNKKH